MTKRVSWALFILFALPSALWTLHLLGRTPAAAASSSLSCGVERWAVKTLTDADARKIDFHPRSTTISALRKLTPTHTSTRGPGVERTTYRIRARLVEAKLEDDQDFHLVVADPRHRSRTMIVEFPAPSCTRHAVKRTAMRQARAAFVSACGSPSSSSFTRLSGKATITGVGFFDFNHGQTGVAPNAIELHPVLAFGAATCRLSAQGSPTTG